MSNEAIETNGPGRAWSLALAIASALGAAGCEATFQPALPEVAVTYDTGAVARAEVVPPDVWSYPHVYYDGAWVYLVDGRWYYPPPIGWMLYRREPVELYRQRTVIGERRYRAPPERRPAPPQPYPSYQEPPRYREYQEPPRYRE